MKGVRMPAWLELANRAVVTWCLAESRRRRVVLDA